MKKNCTHTQHGHPHIDFPSALELRRKHVSRFLYMLSNPSFFIRSVFFLKKNSNKSFLLVKSELLFFLERNKRNGFNIGDIGAKTHTCSGYTFLNRNAASNYYFCCYYCSTIKLTSGVFSSSYLLLPLLSSRLWTTTITLIVFGLV